MRLPHGGERLAPLLLLGVYPSGIGRSPDGAKVGES